MLNRMIFLEEIKENINAGVPCINIVSDEYLRLNALIENCAEELNFQIEKWDPSFNDIRKGSIIRFINNSIDNFIYTSSAPIFEKAGRLIYINNLKLEFRKNIEVLAHFQKILINIQKKHKGKLCIIYTSEEIYIPSELSSLVYLIELKPPDKNDVKEIIQIFINDNKYKIEDELKERLISLCAGISEETIKQILTKIFLKNNILIENVYEIVRKAKEQEISKNGYVELVQLKENISEIGGLEKLIEFLKRKKKIIDNLDSAISSGILPPKGILLAGVPGCGKSLAAKSTANLFNFPLLRIDIGSLMGKYVGESENNLKKALRIAENINPCVLWLDEIEKAFSGVQGDDNDSGVTIRMFGQFLTWMQEKQGTIFVIATANDIKKIPDALLRKGRFDECFFIDLPHKFEREEIINIYLDNIYSKEDNIDIQKISELTDGYSGADIQALINDSLETSFIERRKLDLPIIESREKEMISSKKKLGDEEIKKYQDESKKYGMKPASYTCKEINEIIDKIKQDAKSDDLEKRKGAAKNPLCPQEILEKLANDNKIDVLIAVINNLKCRRKILDNFLIEHYESDQNKLNSKRKREVSHHPTIISIALRHPNTSGKVIADLHKKGFIDNDDYIEIKKACYHTKKFREILDCEELKHGLEPVRKFV